MFLIDLLLVYFVAGVVVYAFHRLRIPAVVGLLVSGVLVGPHGLSWVGDVERVELLAEIGVVVLLFTVGLEFSLDRLLSLSRVMAQIGLPQILSCIGATVLATFWYVGGVNKAVFAGMLVAMSSTAIVLKVYADRGELNAPHGRIVLATLLLQDLLVVVFVLAGPLLSDKERPDGQSVWLSVPLGIAVVVGILAAGKYVVPPLLYKIVRTRNRELFLIAIFVICIGTATLTASVGLSLALGAFIAGLTLGESEYGHQTLAEVLPFRDTLSSLFFVSVGMLLDLHHVAAHGWLVAATVVALVCLKFASVAVPALIAGYPLRTAVVAGLALAQIGEFSFVLAMSGLDLDLMSSADRQTFLAAAVLTMCAAPLLIVAAPAVADSAAALPVLARWEQRTTAVEKEAGAKHPADHVIIAGYGFNGKNLTAILKDLAIPYVVLEMNPQTVRTQRAKGESILFGDCTRSAVLEHAGIHRARVYVVGISDPVSTRRTVQVARQLNGELFIIVRTRYRAEIDDLQTLGASVIVPEEFEASIEIFAQVLRDYHVPGNVISRFVSQLRQKHYEVFRGENLGRERLHSPVDLIGSAETESCLVSDDSSAVGQSIGQLQIRSRTGASIIAVRRDGQILPNPGAEFTVRSGDVLILIGSQQEIQEAISALSPPAT